MTRVEATPSAREALVVPRVRLAQTNIQLYNQLREAGYELNDIVLVKRAYELLIELHPGYYQADGKPFAAHGVGVASALAEAGQPAEILAVGMLHNVYGNGDFGDARKPGPAPNRRRLVQGALGTRVEALLIRYAELRAGFRDLERVTQLLPSLDHTERRLVLVELADHLEKNLDLGCLYYGDGDWVLEGTERQGHDLVDIAELLGQPQLGEMLSLAFADVAGAAGEVAPELRSTDGRRYLKVIVPRSYTLRPSVRLRPLARRARVRLALGTRLRKLPALARRGG
jgi:hypothetical protein